MYDTTKRPATCTIQPNVLQHTRYSQTSWNPTIQPNVLEPHDTAKRPATCTIQPNVLQHTRYSQTFCHRLYHSANKLHEQALKLQQQVLLAALCSADVLLLPENLLAPNQGHAVYFRHTFTHSHVTSHHITSLTQLYLDSPCSHSISLLTYSMVQGPS